MYRLFIENIEIDKPIFENFYFKKTRDELDLLIIRYATEGNIIIKGTDFDNTEPHFATKATGLFYEDNDIYEIEISFSLPDFGKKFVKCTFFIKDKYYNFFNNPALNSQTDIFLSDLTLTETIISVPFEVETETTVSETETTNIVRLFLEHWNDELEIDDYDLLASTLNCTPIAIAETPANAKNKGWKPLLTDYTDFSAVRYREKQTTWIREFKWYSEYDDIQDGFFSTNETQIINGFTYTKYLKVPYPDSEPFTDNSYIIIDGGNAGGSAELSFSDTNFNIKSRAVDFKGLIKQVIESIENNTASLIIPFFLTAFQDRLQITSTANFDNENNNALTDEIRDNENYGDVSGYVAKSNIESYYPDNNAKLNFDYIIEIMRNVFGLYFEKTGISTYQFIRLDFNTYLTDIDLSNYKSFNWLNAGNYILDYFKDKASNLKFITGTKSLDFRDQEGVFDRNIYNHKSQSFGVVTDPNSDGSGNFFLFHYVNNTFNLLNLGFSTVINEGTPVIYSPKGADFVEFAYGANDSFKSRSNVFPSAGKSANFKYNYIVNSGCIIVKITPIIYNTAGVYYYQIHTTGSGSVNVTLPNPHIYGYSILEINACPASTGDGIIKNISLTQLDTKKILSGIGAESGLLKQNSALSQANLLKFHPVIMPDTQGSINGNVTGLTKVFDKTQQFQIPLAGKLSQIDFNKKVKTNYSDMVIFGVKRRIFDKNTQGFDTLTLKDNN